MSIDPERGTSGGTGRCLCGAVSYEVRVPLRDVLVCHCVECRRWHGGPGAYTAAPRADVKLSGEACVRWIDSPESATRARRGFCGSCGSSLFWDAPGRPVINIAAGTLDLPTGLATARHIWTEQAGDWEEQPH